MSPDRCFLPEVLGRPEQRENIGRPQKQISTDPKININKYLVWLCKKNSNLKTPWKVMTPHPVYDIGEDLYKIYFCSEDTYKVIKI